MVPDSARFLRFALLCALVLLPLSVEAQPVLPGELIVNCPADMSVTSFNGSPVVVTYGVTASGGVAPVTVTGSPAPASSFPLGTTPVQVTAQSSDGQTTSCGFSVTVTTSPPTGVGPQSAIPCPAGAVDIVPGNNTIQSFVDVFPAGTTFCLRAGVHGVFSSITPKNGDIFAGEYGAILDGAGWMTSDDTQAAFRANNQDIDYVTIRNLVIRNMPQRAVLAYYELPDHWTIEYNEITANYSGIVFSSYSLIRNNYIHHNSYSGYMGERSSFSTFENNEIAYNGWDQKVSESASVTFRNNFVHHNAGGGIWYDSDNTNALVEGNLVEDNGSSGIWFEIGSGVIIHDNIVRRSGDTAVFISTSKNAEIYNNTLEDNFRGITFFVNCPSVGAGTISFDLANNVAHDNTITVGTRAGAFASVFNYSNCTSAQAAPYVNGSKNLTFSQNTYHVPSLTSGQYWYWYVVKSWNEWQALQQDLTSTVSE